MNKSSIVILDMNDDFRVLKEVWNLPLSMKFKITDNVNQVLMLEKGTKNAYVRDIETREIIKKNEI